MTDGDDARDLAKLDHMAEHHGMAPVACPACEGAACEACGWAGAVFAVNAGGWQNCGVADCPLPRNTGPS